VIDYFYVLFKTLVYNFVLKPEKRAIFSTYKEPPRKYSAGNVDTLKKRKNAAQRPHGKPHQQSTVAAVVIKKIPAPAWYNGSTASSINPSREGGDVQVGVQLPAPARSRAPREHGHYQKLEVRKW
jgi:hypothetical protein